MSSSSSPLKTLEELQFDNQALKSLPVDPRPIEHPATSREVRGACFSRVKPTPVENPQLVSYSAPVLRDLLGINLDTELKRPEFAEYFSGNRIIPGTEPAAHCYCGHQFGSFAGQLGDGATMYLGEVINQSGERWEIQFKGAGKTPYSRFADGRKVLRSSIREYLCSEGNHALGIPTTRAGTVVTSDSKIERDIFYTGNVILERCSIVLRVAPTFLRFGSFEIFKPVDQETGRAGPSAGLEAEMLPKMLTYVIKNFYPEIWNKHPVEAHDDSPITSNDVSESSDSTSQDWKARREARRAMYCDFYSEVVRRTAILVAEWQCSGFCHGVLNTDNMSILGLTIDYGPFGFLDAYDPDFICNGSDNGGRYSYKQQPEICLWNCRKLAEALKAALPLSRSLPLLDEIFEPVFEKHYNEKMRKKLGLLKKDEGEADQLLVKDFLETLRLSSSDFTNSFRGLSILSLLSLNLPEEEAGDYKEAYEYLLKQTGSMEYRIKSCKPSINPRQLQMLLSIAQQDPQMLQAFGIEPGSLMRDVSKLKRMKELESMSLEKKDEEDRALLTKWLGKYRERLRREVEGLSQQEIENLEKERKEVMNANNPKFVLRNYIAQKAIESAEKGDFTEVNRVLEVITHPFSDDPKYSKDSYDLSPPQWAADLCVTCSS